VQLLLTQSAIPYQLRVPLTVRTAAGDEAAIIELAGERANFELTTQARPEAVILDSEFRLFRRLGRHEAQPILRDVMVNPKTATVIAGGDAAFAASAASLAQQLMDYPAKPVNLPQGDIPVLLIGVHFAVDAWLAANGWPARPPEVGRNGSVLAWTVRRADGAVAVVISAIDAGSLAAATRSLPHYGRMSYLVFDGSEVVIKGVWPARPQT
jgi:aminopeptidase N